MRSDSTARSSAAPSSRSLLPICRRRIPTATTPSSSSGSPSPRKEGATLGRVVAVHPGLANDNVELDDGTLVPLIEDAILAIELEARRIVVVGGFLPPPATSRSRT